MKRKTATIVDTRPSGTTNAAQLAALEKHIGHRLPPEYRKFLLRYNGGHPEPDAFVIRRGRREEEHVMMVFFPMRKLSLGTVVVEDAKELLHWPLHYAWDDLQSDLQQSRDGRDQQDQRQIATDLLQHGGHLGSGNSLLDIIAAQIDRNYTTPWRMKVVQEFVQKYKAKSAHSPRRPFRVLAVLKGLCEVAPF